MSETINFHKGDIVEALEDTLDVTKGKQYLITKDSYYACFKDNVGTTRSRLPNRYLLITKANNTNDDVNSYFNKLKEEVTADLYG